MFRYSVYATLVIAVLAIGACGADWPFSTQKFTMVSVGDVIVRMETTTGDLWILNLDKSNHHADPPTWQQIPPPMKGIGSPPPPLPPKDIDVKGIDYQIIEARFKIEHARVIQQYLKTPSYIVLDLIASQDITERLTENLKAGFFDADNALFAVCPVYLGNDFPLKKGEKLTATISCAQGRATPEKWGKLSLRKEI